MLMFLALLFTFSALVTVVESTVKEQTILESFFNGDPDLYFDLVEQEFKRLDSDKDGYLEISDFEKNSKQVNQLFIEAFNNVTGSKPGEDNVDLNLFPESSPELQLELLDANDDDRVSFREFSHVFLDEIANATTTVDDNVCQLAQDVIKDKCLNDSRPTQLLMSILVLRCQSRISSFSDYYTEKCLLAIDSCADIAQCFESLPQNSSRLSKIDREKQQEIDEIKREIEEQKRLQQHELNKANVKNALIVIGFFGGLIAATYFSTFAALLPSTLSFSLSLAMLISNFANNIQDGRFEKTAGLKWDPTKAETEGRDPRLPGDTKAILRADIKCDLWMYWSQDCAAGRTEESYKCSNGGQRFNEHSCHSIFSAGSRPCGALDFGCQSVCIDADFNCNDEFDYQPLKCTSVEPLYDDNLKVVTTASTMKDCRFHCRKTPQCISFVYKIAEWNQANSTCVLFSDATTPNFVDADLASETAGCVYAFKPYE